MLFGKKSLKVYNLPMPTTIFYKATESNSKRFYKKIPYDWFFDHIFRDERDRKYK